MQPVASGFGPVALKMEFKKMRSNPVAFCDRLQNRTRPDFETLLVTQGTQARYAGLLWLVAGDCWSTSPRMEELQSNYVSIALWVRTALEWALTFRHQAQPWAGVQYIKVWC